MKLNRRARERIRHKEEILDAAERVFSRHGFFTTKIQDIARCAEFGIGTIYKHFRNKELIYITLIRKKFSELIYFVNSRVAVENSPDSKMRALIHSHLEFFDLNRGLFKLFATEHLSFERKLKRSIFKGFMENYRSYLKLFRSIYNNGVKRGIFGRGDANALCLALIGMLNQTIFFNFNVSSKERLTQSAEVLYNLFLNGVKKHKYWRRR